MSTFIEPSASGPSQKLENHPDGTVHVTPGKAHEAREGSVSNPGVRTVSSATTGPRCPQCGESSLKMRMNRKAGERVYCSNKNCDYDQVSSVGSGDGRIKPNPRVQTKTVNSRGGASGEETGVKILRHTGPR